MRPARKYLTTKINVREVREQCKIICKRDEREIRASSSSPTEVSTISRIIYMNIMNECTNDYIHQHSLI